MKCFLQTILLLYFAVLSQATKHPQHLFPVFRNIEGFGLQVKVSQQGNKRDSGHQTSASQERWGQRNLKSAIADLAESHEYNYNGDDISANLQYSVEVKPGHLPLLAENTDVTRGGIQRITCLGNSDVSVQYNCRTQASLLATKLSSGTFYSISGACNESGTPFYRKIEKNGVKLLDKTVMLKTSPLNFKELFQNFELKFDVNPSRKLNNSSNDEDRELLLKEDMRVRERDLFLDDIGSLADTLGEYGGELKSKGRFNNAFNSVDKIKSYWTTIKDGVADLFKGGHSSLNETLGSINFNYNSRTEQAAKKSIPFRLTPWATCEDCYFHMDLSVNVEIGFGSRVAIPEKFLVEVGGEIEGNMIVKVKDPKIASQSDNIWHSLIDERKSFGRFYFMVSGIPVVFSVLGGLNAAATSTETFKGEFTFGLQAVSKSKFGAKWSSKGKGNGWEDIADFDWSNAYYLPEWNFQPNNAIVEAIVSPEIVISIYDSVPVVLKLKPRVGAHFGKSVNAVNRASSDNPVTMCEKEHDSYALVTGFSLGLGSDDIKFPDKIDIAGFEVPIDFGVLGLAGITLIGGVDFGEIDILGTSVFPGCGRLCDGCLSSYRLHKQEYIETAFQNSAEKKNRDKSRFERTENVTITLVVLAMISFLVIVFSNSYLKAS